MLRESAPRAPHNPDTPSVYDEDRDTDWSYTARAQDVAELRRQLERERGAKERPDISRDTPISGGVYEGAYGGEAIVVDTEKYPLINRAVEDVLEKVTVGGRIDKGLVLETVYQHVLTNMRYDSAAVEKIFAEDCRGIDGQKISLDTYIQDGVGECRHQALFAGAILEQLAARGIVSGKASVERNMIRSGADGKYDGHSWVRYTNGAGTVYVMDIAQQRLASLDDLMRERREGKQMWDYGRKEDHDKIRGTIAIDAAQAAERAGIVSTDLNEPVIIDKIPDWVLNSGAQQAKATEERFENASTSELRRAKERLQDTANLMASGTIDGYVLMHDLLDISRALSGIDRDLSRAVGDIAEEAKQQAGQRYGFTPDIIARLRRLAAAI